MGEFRTLVGLLLLAWAAAAAAGEALPASTASPAAAISPTAGPTTPAAGSSVATTAPRIEDVLVEAPAPPIAFGDALIRGLHVVFSDMFIFEHWRMTRDPVLLIGMDVLGLLDILVIDYKRREIRFRTRF